MHDKPFDILTLNETRLDDSIPNSEIKISGYDIVRRDRNRNGGGVAMYIRSCITFTNRNDLVPESLEQICVEINKPKSKPFLVSSWYRPPNSKIEIFNFFEELLKLVDIEDKELITTGDLNCDLLQPDKNASTARLLDIFNIYLLKQHIQSPTRVTLNSQTLIDVIISSIENNKTVEAGVVELGISDHNLVYICRKVSVPKEPPKIIFSRQFKNFRVNEFRTDLRNIFATNIITDDPNNMWHDWKNRFLHVDEKHAPTRQRRVKSDYKPWLTEHIKKQCYHRDFLNKKQAVKLKSAYYDTAYKRHKNYVKLIALSNPQKQSISKPNLETLRTATIAGRQ